MAVHFHKGKICFNGYLTEKDWTGIWLGPPFKYSSSCGTPCPAFLKKLCPDSFFLLTHMILSPFDFDQFLLPVAGKKFSARAKSLRLPFLLSFFLSFTEGWFLTNASSAHTCWLFYISYWTLSFLHCSQRLRLYLNLYFYFGKHFHVNTHLLNISNGTN